MNQDVYRIVRGSGFDVLKETQDYIYLRGEFKGLATVIYADEKKQEVIFLATDFPGKNKKKYSYSEFLTTYSHL